MSRNPDDARSKRALLADGCTMEILLFHECLILGAGINATGEHIIVSATCEAAEAFRRIHAVVDEVSRRAYRGGALSFASILQAAPFYLVTTPFQGGAPTISEMTWDELGADDRPASDSFCPAHADWTMEKTQ